MIDWRCPVRSYDPQMRCKHRIRRDYAKLWRGRYSDTKRANRRSRMHHVTRRRQTPSSGTKCSSAVAKDQPSPFCACKLLLFRRTSAPRPNCAERPCKLSAQSARTPTRDRDNPSEHETRKWAIAHRECARCVAPSVWEESSPG